MHRILICLSVALVGGCASTHDLSKGPNYLGGGVQKSEIKPGFHSILARTNWAPWSNFSGAQGAWKSTADELCGATKYQEFGSWEAARDTGMQPMGVLRYIVTERFAYALCNDSQISLAEAMSLVDFKPKQ